MPVDATFRRLPLEAAPLAQRLRFHHMVLKNIYMICFIHVSVLIKNHCHLIFSAPGVSFSCLPPLNEVDMIDLPKI